MKPHTAPSGGKLRGYHPYLQNNEGEKGGGKVIYKDVEHHRFTTKKTLMRRTLQTLMRRIERLKHAFVFWLFPTL